MCSRRLELKKCPVCGKSFPENRQHRPKTYCSRQCAGLSTSKRYTIQCRACGKRIKVSRSRLDTRYCSSSCRYRAHRQVANWPTLNQLLDLLERATLKQIGELYGVSATTVKYWILKQGGQMPTLSEIRRSRRARVKNELAYAKSGTRIIDRRGE